MSTKLANNKINHENISINKITKVFEKHTQTHIYTNEKLN